MKEKPIRLLTGNHDLESQDSSDLIFNSDSTPGSNVIETKNKKCATTEQELFLCDNIVTLSCKARNDPKTYYVYDQSCKTLL